MGGCRSGIHLVLKDGCGLHFDGLSGLEVTNHG